MRASCKIDFRKTSLKARDEIAQVERAQMSVAACKRLITDPLFQKAKAIHAFVAFRSEIDTKHLIETAWQTGKKLICPITDTTNKTLIHKQTHSWDDFVAGYAGIMEPKPDCPDFDIKALDLVLIPGCAFDEYGRRMGYGGGFYDRFLGLTPATRIALAFDSQVVEKVPFCPHDLPVEYIFTETRSIKCYTENAPGCPFKEKMGEACPHFHEK